jgi:hypothetical protein
MASDDDWVPRFTIDSTIKRQYRRFNALGTELTVRLLPPVVGDDSDAVTHFQASVNDLFDFALRNVADGTRWVLQYKMKLILIKQSESALDERTSYQRK